MECQPLPHRQNFLKQCMVTGVATQLTLRMGQGLIQVRCITSRKLLLSFHEIEDGRFL